MYLRAPGFDRLSGAPSRRDDLHPLLPAAAAAASYPNTPATMKLLLPFLIRLLVLSALVPAVPAGKEGVHTLAAHNFDATVSRGDCALVSFFAPWCGHCKQMIPAWERLAQEREDCLVAKVDATEQKALAARFNVNGYPSIFHIKGRSVRVYQGGRSFEAFEKFLDKEWEDTPTLSFIASPYGPIGTAKGMLIRFGGNVLNSYGILLDSGYSEVLAGLIIVCGGMFLVFLVIAVLLFFESGDSPPHAHRA